MKINLPKKKINKRNIFSIITAVLLLLAHVAVLLVAFLTYKYYSIYPALFISIVGIIICLLIVMDIFFFVGFNHKDLLFKIITLVLSICILAGGTVGTYYISEVNGVLGEVLGNGSSDSYETYSGTFVCYSPNNQFSELSDLENKKVGMLNETSNGLTYIATNILDEEGFDYASLNTYTSNTELVNALIEGKVDAIVITSAYRSIYKNDDNSNIKDYLDDFIDFYSFEEELKITSTKKKKDITKEPFNVLLIGYSRTDIGSSVGLADAIIVCTINPLTYTVSMMSIARDSFVPISCYGGSYDKINSGRSTSRQCFIDTVEDFIGMDIDYYIEADYYAIIYMANNLGGVKINNPVDFELDGVYVPAGEYVAEGWQVLEFMRERHHMPNGDFDRQQHQKEVIIEMCRMLIESGDINLALNTLKAGSQWLDTNFTINELTSVFNLLLNTKNYTSLDTFDLVDFQTLRMTGYGGIMYYSYSMGLPLWVYLIYQGSYDESIAHIEDVMGNYSLIEQDYEFNFSSQSPYERAAFYSETYEHEFLYQPDPMPAYWANLEGMNYLEALEWAEEKGVTLTLDYIYPDDPDYDAELDGTVVDQSVRYGDLISQVSSGTITIMGTGEIDDSKQVPNLKSYGLNKTLQWADNYDIDIDIVYQNVEDESVGKVIAQSIRIGSDIDNARNNGITITLGIKEFSKDSLVGMTGKEVKSWVENNLYYSEDVTYVIVDSEIAETNKVLSVSYDTSENGDLFTYSKDVVITIEKYRQEYSVKYVDFDGSLIYETKVKEGENTPNCPITPNRIGYSFKGWSPSIVTTVSSDVTYTATYEDLVKNISLAEAQALCGDSCILNYSDNEESPTPCTLTYKNGVIESCICELKQVEESGETE